MYMCMSTIFSLMSPFTTKKRLHYIENCKITALVRKNGDRSLAEILGLRFRQEKKKNAVQYHTVGSAACD